MAGRDAIEAERHREAESTISYERLGYAVGAAVQFFYTFGDDRGNQATAGIEFGSESDLSVQQIHRDFSLPGSNAMEEAEALYEYRIGLKERLCA